jgi:hypothetical protein
MRDIRPAPKPKRELPNFAPMRDVPILPEDIKKASPLPTRPAISSRRPAIPHHRARATRLTGSAVPVTNIPAPEPRPAAAAPKRPLFYRRQVGRTRTAWRVGHKERLVLLAVFGLVLVAAALAAFIFLPKAEIKLILRTAPLLVDEQLTIRAANTEGPNIVPGAVFFREIQTEGESPVTSTEVIGTKATGTVRIVNKTVDQQGIKENSRLVTADGVLFYMQNQAVVPPNGAVTVPVVAAESGEAGNIKPQRLSFAALPAGTSTLLYAEATQTFTGGSGQTVTVVKDVDLEEAKKTATDTIREQAQKEISSELPAGWQLLNESWSVEPQSFDTPVKVGDRVSGIKYTARIVARVLGYEQKKLEAELEEALNQRLDKEYMLFPGSINATYKVDKVDWAQAEGLISARVTHTTIPRFSVEALRDKLAGRSQLEAKKYLEGLPGIRTADISLSPFWVNTIPRIERRVTIDLVSENQP